MSDWGDVFVEHTGSAIEEAMVPVALQQKLPKGKRTTTLVKMKEKRRVCLWGW